MTRASQSEAVENLQDQVQPSTSINGAENGVVNGETQGQMLDDMTGVSYESEVNAYSDVPHALSFSPLDVMGNFYDPFNMIGDWTDFNSPEKTLNGGHEQLAIVQSQEQSPHQSHVNLTEENGHLSPHQLRNANAETSGHMPSSYPETYGIHTFTAGPDDAPTTSTSKGASLRASPIRIEDRVSSGLVIPQPKTIAQQDRSGSISQQRNGTSKSPRNTGSLRYPVLRDTIHLLRPLIPDSLAFDLLEAYFNISKVTGATTEPCAPPLVFRRHSFLGQEDTRKCSHALLVSMLWLSAQTANIPFLNASIARRKQVRRRLLALTTRLLKPLNEVSLGIDLVLQSKAPREDGGVHEGPVGGTTDSLGEIMAYAHLGMVTSASEFKGASLRWWNLAFTLAREARLYQELPDASADDVVVDEDYDMLPESPPAGGSYAREADHSAEAYTPTSASYDERREERRRVWWFLYTMDRHLCISYNKPLALLDGECQSLYQPDDDTYWQSDQPYIWQQRAGTKMGPTIECRGLTFFGFFTPLTTLLGEIVYFIGAQNHPRFGVTYSTLRDWKEWEKGIERSIDNYEVSLRNTLDAGTVSSPVVSDSRISSTTTSPLNASDSPLANSTIPLQSRIVYAYAKLILEVLRVLLLGKWDPLTLLNNSDAFVAGPAFALAVEHANSAAKAAEDLLDLDPGVQFMPFYLGVYLFQGSLPLVLVADRLAGDADATAIKACSTMIRVHESSIVRMPSEYQVRRVSLSHAPPLASMLTTDRSYLSLSCVRRSLRCRGVHLMTPQIHVFRDDRH